MVRLLIKAALFLAAVGGIALIGGGLIRDPGQVSVHWGGWVAELRASTLLLGILLAVALLWVIASLWTAIFGLPSSIGGFARRRRQRKGLEALGRAITAYTAEDGATALANARRAERLLVNPRLTRALMARSLDMQGRATEAQRYYKALSNNRDTAMAGVRGLLAAALREGDVEEAERLARRAIELDPRNPAALSALLRLQVEAGEWNEARHTVQDQTRARLIKRDESRRMEAALYVAEAMQAETDGNKDQARALAMRAAEMDPGLPPAAELAARLTAAAGERRRADRYLLQAWKRSPMPVLARLWMETGATSTPRESSRRLQRLVETNPTHSESRLLMAEAAVAQRNRLAVLEALEPLQGAAAQEARYCAAMAAIERWSTTGEANARRWLAKALTAPRGRGWKCQACGVQSETWHVNCPQCSELATMEPCLLDGGATPSPEQVAPPTVEEPIRKIDETEKASVPPSHPKRDTAVSTVSEPEEVARAAEAHDNDKDASMPTKVVRPDA